MATNAIARRIYDFLKDIPPFNLIDQEDLLHWSARVEVLYLPAGKLIFDVGEPPKNGFFVVREGAVDLLSITPTGQEVLVERCAEGELFGIRPLLAGDNYHLRARAAEESLIYAIQTEGLRENLVKYPKVVFYLAAMMAGARNIRRETATAPVIAATDTSFAVGGLLELQSVQRAKDPVTCQPDTPIYRAAEIMSEQDVGSIIIVDEQQHPVGILTDRDIRRNVATGLYGRNRPIKEVMSYPVVCISRDVVVAEVQIAMVKYNIHHLIVTEDGTDQSPILGVISEHDLLVLSGNNPAVLVREISRSKTVAYLRELRIRAEGLLRQYLEQEVSITYIMAIMTEINDQIISRCIRLSIKDMLAQDAGEPPCRYAWMSLGSQGRGEQLLRTDQDSALVFEDLPEGQHGKAKAYFVEMAQLVTEKLYQVGYAYCSGNMMASNPKWCLPTSGWKQIFTQWMKDPKSENILHVSVFFDYRCIYGDASLTAGLTNHIFNELEQTTIFQAFLARAALQNPAPLTFFRNFMVERSGEYKDQFDLKGRAMMPLTDAARVLILQAKKGGVNNTIQRFKALAALEPQNEELYLAAAEAYEILVRMRARIGLKREDNGRYLKPTELGRFQKVLLRNTFNPIQEIQQLLEVRFQINFIR